MDAVPDDTTNDKSTYLGEFKDTNRTKFIVLLGVTEPLDLFWAKSRTLLAAAISSFRT
jgi:hypothetical protein